MNKLIVAIALLGAGLVVYAVTFHNKMAAALPVPIMCDSQSDAWSRAMVGGDSFSAVLGTGSMAPVIPHAPEGTDPQKTVVAYVSIVNVAFGDVSVGDLVIYEPQWDLPEGLRHARVIHQAAAKDAGGWIMSGLNNAHYENMHRVTEEDYYGVANNIYLWPLTN